MRLVGSQRCEFCYSSHVIGASLYTRATRSDNSAAHDVISDFAVYAHVYLPSYREKMNKNSDERFIALEASSAIFYYPM
jgi:hypothetical protein